MKLPQLKLPSLKLPSFKLPRPYRGSVIVVEHDAAAAHRVCSELRAFGWSWRLASCSAEALRLAEQDWPDTFLIEQQLPDEDWRVLVWRLRILRPDLYNHFALLELEGMNRAAQARARQARESVESGGDYYLMGVRAIIGPRGLNWQLYDFLSHSVATWQFHHGPDWEEERRCSLRRQIEQHRRDQSQ